MMVKLGDICTFQSGGTPSKSNSEYFNGSIPWITTVALTGDYIGKNDAVDWITDKAIQESAAKIIPENSIMVGTRVGIGKVAINAIPMSASQDIVSLMNIDDAKWDKKFLCKVISARNPYLLSQARGATIKGIKIDTLAKLEIPEIPLNEQRRIAAVLDKVSGLIAKRREQLDKLDELVKARFVEMFGDPVSNLKGWERGTIRDVVSEVKYGTSRPAVDGGAYKYLRMGNITFDGHLDLSDLKYIDIPDSELEKCLVRKGDVLFNRTNSKELVGKTCVFDLDEPMVIAGYIIRVRVNKKVLPIYLSAVLNSRYGKQTLADMCKAIVGQANINAQELQDIAILIPPIELQEKFSDYAETIKKSKLTIQQSLDKLEVLKKALMQQYFER